MPDTVAKTVSKKAKINPFCFVPERQIKRVLGKPGLVTRYEGGEFTEDHSYIPGLVAFDLDAEIQSCKELAGFEYMQQQLKTGRASIEDFYDDGKHDFDQSQVPENIHQANAQANVLNGQLADLAKTIGVPEGEAITGAQFEKYLSEYIAKEFAKQQAAAKPEGGE